MIFGRESYDRFVVTRKFRDWPWLKLVTKNVQHFSLPKMILSLTFIHHFEEEKVLNRRDQIDWLLHTYHEIYYRLTFFVFRDDLLVTPISRWNIWRVFQMHPHAFGFSFWEKIILFAQIAAAALSYLHDDHLFHAASNRTIILFLYIRLNHALSEARTLFRV
jgi:hypothetical protein